MLARLTLIALLAALIPACTALAQTAAEQRYLATRDAAVAATKQAEDAKQPTAGTDKHVDAALTDMQQQLRAILGAVKVKGVGPEGRLHLDTFSQGDIGFGALDALDFKSADGKVTATVTTVNLLKRWIADHKDWWEKNAGNVPLEIPAALKSDAFYTQALSQDSAVMHYADLPLKKPKGAEIALAVLTASSQDQAPPMADEIYVAAVAQGRAYILRTNAARRLGPIAACDSARKQYDAKAEAESDADRRFALQARSEDEFRGCFAREAPKQPGFAALVKEAEALLARLPL